MNLKILSWCIHFSGQPKYLYLLLKAVQQDGISKLMIFHSRGSFTQKYLHIFALVHFLYLVTTPDSHQGECDFFYQYTFVFLKKISKRPFYYETFYNIWLPMFCTGGHCPNGCQNSLEHWSRFANRSWDFAAAGETFCRWNSSNRFFKTHYLRLRRVCDLLDSWPFFSVMIE